MPHKGQMNLLLELFIFEYQYIDNINPIVEIIVQ